MKNTYFKCMICGNLVKMVHASGVPIHCCGKPMNELMENKEDASLEKHVPVCKKVGTNLEVIVGSAIHPMSEEHYIMWISIAQNGLNQHVDLKPTDKPIAHFNIQDGPVTVYAYCNLHGLWTSEIVM